MGFSTDTRHKRFTRILMGSLTAVLLTTSGVRAQQGPPPPDFLVTARSVHDFDATVDLLKQAIEGENLMVVQEVDAQQMLRMVGMRVGGMKQIFFFHPRYMKAIIETNRNGGIVPPLKILVMERPDGAAMVRYHDPVDAFAAYDGLGEIAMELRGIFEAVVGSVTN